MPETPGLLEPPPAQSAAPPAPRPAVGLRALSDNVHLLDRLAAVYQYRYTALGVFVLTFLIAMIQGRSTTIRMYEARGRVLIEDPRSSTTPGVGMTGRVYGSPQVYYQTESSVFKGRDLAQIVVRRLKLDSVPEFNGTMPAAPPTTLAVIREIPRRVWRIIRAAPVAADPHTTKILAPDLSTLVDAFLARVRVSSGENRSLIDVTFQSVNPDFAALAVSTLMEEYVRDHLDTKLRSVKITLDWMSNEVAKQQLKVEEAERALVEYRNRKNAFSVDDKQNIGLAQLKKLNDDLAAVKTRRAQKEVLYTRLTGAHEPADTLSAIAQMQNVQTARVRLLDAERARQAAASRYGDKHPTFQRTDAGWREAKQQYDVEVARAVEQAKQDYQSAVLEEQMLTRALDGAKVNSRETANKAVDYSILEREAISNRQIYQVLLQRENELRIASNSEANNVRILEHADVPAAPMPAPANRTWLLSLTIALTVSLVVTYGLDYMNESVKTPDDVGRYLKLPFLGLVPSVAGDQSPILFSHDTPQDFGEACRGLRTALTARYPPGGPTTLVVTSTLPLEGKSTAAANIAIALAYGGERVLLIDADMRRPGLHSLLGLTNDRGLSEVLRGQLRLRVVLQRTQDPNLLLLAAGRVPSNPSELLGSERMRMLVSNLAHGPFKWIIFDTPPVLAVTDPVILAGMVTGVTFITAAATTPRRQAQRAIMTLLASCPRDIAVVLNKVNMTRDWYYARHYARQSKEYV
jgi:succinoglycan biosynthesis transport protein ExoP